MASDRLNRDYAQQFPLPEHTWHWGVASKLLEQPIIKNNIHVVGLNKPLYESLKREPIMYNPFFCMNSWWPIVGSQRLRAIQEIREKDDPNFDVEVKVARLNKNYLAYTQLWPEKEFRSKMSAVTLQMWELVFKSLYFEVDKTKDGIQMTEFEDEGDRNSGWKFVPRPSENESSQPVSDQE
jgi:hypothetical protein